MVGERRDRRIDALRGLAIFLVMLHHFHLAYGLGPGLLYRNGNYGVIIFFAISGYLITASSLRRFGALRSLSLRRFLVYRAARIQPPLLLVLAVITGLGLAGVKYFASNKPVSFLIADLSVLTFWHNQLMATQGYFNYGLNTFWSLSVEEVFYLCFPLLCLALQRNSLIAGVWIAAIVVAPVYRGQHSRDEIQFLYANTSCFDAIAMGCLAGLLARPGVFGEWRALALQGTCLAGMCAVFFAGSIGANAVWGPSAMALAAAGFLWAEGSRRDGAGWARERWYAPICFLGRHSYELYLFHIVVLAGMRNWIDRSELPATARWPWFVLFVAVSSVLAWGVARWFGDPANRWLRSKLA